jgi:hypothetical protein
VLDNRVLWKVCGPEREGERGSNRSVTSSLLGSSLCSFLYHEAPHYVIFSSLHWSFVIAFSPDIIKMIKSRRMRWVGHVACMGENKNTYRVLVGEI